MDAKVFTDQEVSDLWLQVQGIAFTRALVLFETGQAADMELPQTHIVLAVIEAQSNGSVISLDENLQAIGEAIIARSQPGVK